MLAAYSVESSEKWKGESSCLKSRKNFPGGSVVKTLCFHCGRYGFDLWSGNWDPAYCKVQPENRKKEKAFSLLFLWSLSWLVMVFLFADWCCTPSCLRTPEAWVWPSPTTQLWPLCGMSSPDISPSCFTPRPQPVVAGEFGELGGAGSYGAVSQKWWKARSLMSWGPKSLIHAPWSHPTSLTKQIQKLSY